MNLKPAICTHCGATLSVDPDMDAVICQYCNSPFIVEKGVEKFSEIYISTATIQAENIILSGKDKDFEIVAGELRTYSGDSTEVVIPDHVQEIGMSAFKNMGIKTVRMSDNVESIKDGAFSGCKYLTEITMSKNLKFIGNYAFANCCSLTKILIPNSIEEIGTPCFYNCQNLVEVNIEEGFHARTIKSNIGVFLCCNSLKIIKLPEGIYPDLFFSKCNGIQEVIFSDNIDLSKSGAIFSLCANLSDIKPIDFLEKWAHCFDYGVDINKIKRCERFEDSVQGDIYLKSDGTLGLLNEIKVYNPTIFTWKNIKKFKLEYFIIALTYSGDCIVDDGPRNRHGSVILENYKSIEMWHNISYMFTSHNYWGSRCKDFPIVVYGIKKDGSVVSCPEIPEITNWRNIKKIMGLSADTDSGEIIALKNDGTIISTTQNLLRLEKYKTWNNISDIFITPTYKIVFALTSDGEVLSYPDIEELHKDDAWKNIIKLSFDDTNNGKLMVIGICKDGNIVSLEIDNRGQKCSKRRTNPCTIQILHYSFANFRALLNDGSIISCSNGNIVYETKDSNVIAIFNEGVLKKDGRFYVPLFQEGKRSSSFQLLVDKPVNYGVKPSSPIKDDFTKNLILQHIKNKIQITQSQIEDKKKWLEKVVPSLSRKARKQTKNDYKREIKELEDIIEEYKQEYQFYSEAL